LKELFETIKFITNPSNLQKKEQLLDSIKIHKEAISNKNIDSDKFKKYSNTLKSSQDNLYKEFDSKPIKISWKNSKEILEKTKDNVFLVSFFE
ncbi:hypothetical protein, partial [Staphylococcus aureus]|uniref:hypothetical protein n=1 Tax=Staphylococcus aureus TaxID=1280 RepID=UPI00301CA48C